MNADDPAVQRAIDNLDAYSERYFKDLQNNLARGEHLTVSCLDWLFDETGLPPGTPLETVVEAMSTKIKLRAITKRLMR